ncbi:MAG: aminotransferase class I/II-fold pyridoxal phosphate-dependent enzyme [Ferrimicrobium sp.]|jgi:cystathionine beta-lyase|nr:aminotransferase class I/II-fold pyridoxal phosphate-dependent enzyme [Ferrimicrobium sp.]
MTPLLPPEETIAAVRDRRAHSYKWRRYGADIVPAWVADMDFPPPRRALEAGIALLEAGDTGYPSPDLVNDYEAAYQAWAQTNFGTQPNSLRTVGDVVAALRIIVTAVTDPGAGVIVLTPSYPPFFSVVAGAERQLITVPMLYENRKYHIDMERLAEAADDPHTQAIIVCNPHNPTGRVFTGEELVGIATLAERANLTVISDEIHQDLRGPNTRHIPFTSLDHPVGGRAIVLSSPSKSFNIAGLKVAHIELPNDQQLRNRIEASGLLTLSQATSMGLIVGTQAYRTEGGWLTEVNAMIDDNFLSVAKGLGDLDVLTLAEREGTYLQWAQLQRLPEGQSAFTLLLDRAHVAVGAGEDYLPGAPSYFRLNLAAWPSAVATMIERIHDALSSL